MNRHDSIIEIKDIVCDSEFIEWDKLRNKTVLVSGATGLIGYTFVISLLYASHKRKLNIKLLALVRDIEKANKRFEGEDYSDDELVFIVGTVENLPVIKNKIDYIVHAASKTASMAFVKEPVETINTSVVGTTNMLNLAKEKSALGFVYLSSMEVYGYPQKGHKVVEADSCALKPQDVRNSYPISKVLSEALCKAYSEEYKVPAMVARLTQTFGPGVDYNDGRIFAEFGRCIVEKRDIILKTKGETERCYLHTADAVTAILTIMLNGVWGEAYNVANEETYCSIAEMASIVAMENGSIKVVILDKNNETNEYLNTLYMNLDTSKLKSLGWNTQFNGGVARMIESMVDSWDV